MQIQTNRQNILCLFLYVTKRRITTHMYDRLLNLWVVESVSRGAKQIKVKVRISPEGQIMHELSTRQVHLKFFRASLYDSEE